MTHVHSLSCQGTDMVDDEKCRKCFRIAKSFYGKSWASLVKFYRESASFRLEWQAALKRNEETVRKWSSKRGVNVRKATGFELAAIYFFLTVRQFVTKYEMEPKDCGIHLMKVMDEFGLNELSGVVVRAEADDHPWLYRQIKFFNMQNWEMLEELLEPNERLRESEPQQTHLQLCKEKKAEHKVTRFFSCKLQ